MRWRRGEATSSTLLSLLTSIANTSAAFGRSSGVADLHGKHEQTPCHLRVTAKRLIKGWFRRWITQAADCRCDAALARKLYRPVGKLYGWTVQNIRQRLDHLEDLVQFAGCWISGAAQGEDDAEAGARGGTRTPGLLVRSHAGTANQ